MIECLKEAGLQIREIRYYIMWYQEGDASIEKRLKIIQRARKRIEAEVAHVQIVFNKILYKEALYQEAAKLGSLEAAQELSEIVAMKERLYDANAGFRRHETKKEDAA